MFKESLPSGNGLYMMYLLFYIPSTLFVHYPVAAKLGSRGVYIVATLLSILCLWLRVAITTNAAFGTAMWSNVFGGISFALYLNEIPTIAHHWFPSAEVGPPKLIRG